MNASRKLSVLIAAGLVSGCAHHLANVPVVGPAPAIRQLEGEWVGEYWRGASGREGALYFELAVGEKIASGDVWMNLQGQGPPPRYQGSAPVANAAAKPLTIRFVWIEENFVSGTLEMYRDPVTDNILLTTFRGRVENGAIKGTFVTENKTTGAITSGDWSARRVVSAAVAEP
jgi:hypothetical protein